MYLAKTPDLLKPLYRDLLWHVDTTRKELYLTFDDGPIPEVTPWVLDQLKQFKAKATFFCIGQNIETNPEIFQRIEEEGHRVGNHTYDHASGWSSTNKQYFRSVLKCQELTGSELFRPPYGRIKREQAKHLQRHFRIVMWDVLSGDFDLKASNDKCLSNVVDNAGCGSIIVFHDSLKAKERLEFALPKVLGHFSGMGYAFKTL